MLGWDRRDFMAAKGLVKAWQAARGGEVSLLRLAYAGQRVEIRCQPATILDQKPGNEVGCGTRTYSHQILPGIFRGRATRNENSSGPNTNLAAVKIQDRSAQNKFLRA